MFGRPLSARDRAPRLLALVDSVFDRIYGAVANPLYQSGNLVVACLVVMVATGLYLLFAYRTEAPYDSVRDLANDPWLGAWIRSLHRYAADLAAIATAVHCLRLFLQGRTSGPRTLAWTSGVLLAGFLLVSGWTGIVLRWDLEAQVFATEGARLLDRLPVFSEPLSRTFADPARVGRAFFFMNLVAHVALPIGIGLFLWVHTARLARPKLFPPRLLFGTLVVLLLALSVVWPAPLLGPADLLRVPGRVPVDSFYGFWIPLARLQPPLHHLAVWAGGFLGLLSVPWWWRPRREAGTEPSRVDERLCTGCSQCYFDCPFEAIAMVPRTAGRGSELVARVDPERCVSCGICAGSCAPMGIGPPGRTGRDQLEALRALLEGMRVGPDRVLAFSCRNGLDRDRRLVGLEGVSVLTVHCVGAVHTSVIEAALRRGFGGVFLLGCPIRNCIYREGTQWLIERTLHGREAELKDRVDRRRVEIGQFGAGDSREAAAAVAAFRRRVLELVPEASPEPPEFDSECKRPASPRASAG